MLHLGHVSASGQLVLDDRSKLTADVRRFAGKRVELVVRLRRSQRSVDQNRWLRGVAIKILAEHLGYDRHEYEDLHYALMEKCFGTRWNRTLQRQVPKVRSSKMSTREFSDYMEWLVRYAAQEFHCHIPLPNEVDVEEAGR